MKFKLIRFALVFLLFCPAFSKSLIANERGEVTQILSLVLKSYQIKISWAAQI